MGVTVPHTPVAPACPPQVPDTQRCCTRGGSRDGTRTGASASSPPRTRAGRTPQPPMALFPPSFPDGDTLLTPHCASTPPTQAQGPRRCFRQSHHTLIFFSSGSTEGVALGCPRPQKERYLHTWDRGGICFKCFPAAMNTPHYRHWLVGHGLIVLTRRRPEVFLVVDWRRLPTPKSRGLRGGGVLLVRKRATTPIANRTVTQGRTNHSTIVALNHRCNIITTHRYPAPQQPPTPPR